MAQTMQKSEQKPINPKKQGLILLSQKARDFRDAMLRKADAEGDEMGILYWSSRLVNDIIAQWYRDQTGAQLFKTYKQWKEDGQQVRKGETAFLLWAKKEGVFKKDETGKPSDQIDYEFFPVAYLFSNLQVDPAQVPQMEEAAT